MTSYTPVQLAYIIIEPSSGVDENKCPVIFLHGMTRSKEYWLDIPQKVANSTKRKVYAVDARNHGDSEWSDHFSFDTNADDLLSFMDKMNIKKAVLVGHSMGGMTGIRVALAQPDRVEKLVVEDMSIRLLSQSIIDVVHEAMIIATKIIHEIQTELDESDAKNAIGKLFFQHLPPNVQGLMKRSKHDNLNFAIKKNVDGRWAFKANYDVLLRVMKTPYDSMTEPQGVFHGPALFIYGVLSPFPVKSEEENINRQFPNAVFSGIEEATHSVHTDCPDKFTEEIIKFIASKP